LADQGDQGEIGLLVQLVRLDKVTLEELGVAIIQ